MTTDQRLVDQIAVPCDTNEEAATAAHFPKMDLAGVCVTGDAAHTTKANCRQLPQNNGADYVLCIKGNQPTAKAKAQQLLPGDSSPLFVVTEKGHGRIETRSVWHCLVDPETMGLAGAAQLIRVNKHVQHVRKGRVWKETSWVAFVFTNLWEDEITPQEILRRARLHWSIENRQHYRRDRTQDEDRCGTQRTKRARHLSLLRSVSIFLFEQQRHRRDGCNSLPSLEAEHHRQPRGLIARFTWPVP
jgi:predicted transposase YbfD/YdcC